MALCVVFEMKGSHTLHCLGTFLQTGVLLAARESQLKIKLPQRSLNDLILRTA